MEGVFLCTQLSHDVSVGICRVLSSVVTDLRVCVCDFLTYGVLIEYGSCRGSELEFRPIAGDVLGDELPSIASQFFLELFC